MENTTLPNPNIQWKSKICVPKSKRSTKKLNFVRIKQEIAELVGDINLPIWPRMLNNFFTDEDINRCSRNIIPQKEVENIMDWAHIQWESLKENRIKNGGILRIRIKKRQLKCRGHIMKILGILYTQNISNANVTGENRGDLHDELL